MKTQTERFWTWPVSLQTTVNDKTDCAHPIFHRHISEDIIVIPLMLFRVTPTCAKNFRREECDLNITAEIQPKKSIFASKRFQQQNRKSSFWHIIEILEILGDNLVVFRAHLSYISGSALSTKCVVKLWSVLMFCFEVNIAGYCFSSLFAVFVAFKVKTKNNGTNIQPIWLNKFGLVFFSCSKRIVPSRKGWPSCPQGSQS